MTKYKSIAKLFVFKYMKDYNNGIITYSELESSIINLIAKFEISELIDFLSIDLINYLKTISSQEDEENFYMMSGCFGPEFDYEKFINERNKNFNKAKIKLKKYFENK